MMVVGVCHLEVKIHQLNSLSTIKMVMNLWRKVIKIPYEMEEWTI